MAVLLWILAVLLVVAGLAGTVLPVLPAPLLLFGGLLAAAWAEGLAYVGTGTLIALGFAMLGLFLVVRFF